MALGEKAGRGRGGMHIPWERHLSRRRKDFSGAIDPREEIDMAARCRPVVAKRRRDKGRRAPVFDKIKINFTATAVNFAITKDLSRSFTPARAVCPALVKCGVACYCPEASPSINRA